jgi:extracellular elastinolytic metalloproteinase
MPRQKDTRQPNQPRRAEAAVRETADLVSARLNGSHRIEAERVNPITGNAATLHVTDPPLAQGSLIQQALDYVQGGAREAVSFGPTDHTEFVPDPYVQQTKGGSSVVHLHQRYRGIPLFQMTRSVQFTPDRKIDRVVGDSTSIATEIDTTPKITAAAAVRIAASYLVDTQEDEAKTDHWGQTYSTPRITLPAGYQPETVSKFESPSQPTTIAAGPFGDEIKAGLVLFVQPQDVRLAWRLLITMPDDGGQYLMLVAADRPITDKAPSDDFVLYCKDVTHSAVQGNVFRHNPGQGTRTTVEFPMPTGNYPISGGVLPTPFPNAWWVESDATSGNCTTAVSGFTTTNLRATSHGAGFLFNPAQDQGDEQKILNIFYFCNFMHDFLFMLGFDEVAGNFQTLNFSSQGTAGDAVLARAHPGPVRGTANMGTPIDGQNPVMNMGLVSSSGRHTAFDSDVVFHEYCHGLSNRLIGGRMNDEALVEPQSSGMGEGWSDYFALTIQNHDRPVEKTVTGDWVVDRPSGIRMHPYDSRYPGRFGDLGSPPYDSDEHAVGEIWCAALMQMNRNLGATLGSAKKGHEIGWRIVVDGMKLTNANPSFLDARDGILKALDGLQHSGTLSAPDVTKARKAAWQAFAQFGMGARATSNGPSLSGVTGDSTLPTGL